MTIVLLHGFPLDHTFWNKLISFSKQKENIVCIDLPGFGDNSKYFSQGETVELMADFVKKQINKLRKKKVILIGHSLGGYVALAFAQKYPETLAGLGLFHSTATPDTEERKAARLKTIDFVKANGAVAYHRVIIPNLFKTGTDPKVIEIVIKRAKTAKSDGMIAALNAMRNRPARIDILEKFGKPILFIAGESDTLIPKHIILEQAALCQTSQIEVLENSAHMGPIEEPKRSAKIIDEFVKLVQNEGMKE